ncbi:MAG: helix-turn-helix transcriptional regulator [Phycisphaerales bacterium]|nr:helix-turn-helix transcriptional regulator [Phycisphaerales bacterium]
MAAADIKSQAGERVRRLRDHKGWSQERLGFESGLHRNYIGGIERGERNVAVVNIAKLANALGVRPRALLP